MNQGVRVKGIIPYLFILPILVGVGVFGFYCVAHVVLLSFTKTNLINSENVGFANYIYIFKERWFWMALSHTLYYAAWVVPLNLMVGMGLALMMSKKVMGGTVFRFIYLLPWVSSIVIIALVFRYIFNPEWGIANWFLTRLGFDKIMWTEGPIHAIPVVAMMEAWQNMGFGMIIFLGGMTSIKKEVLEAASLDGANEIKRFFHIIIPLLKPTIFFYLVISLIQAFQVFDGVYAFVEGLRGTQATEIFTSPILVSSYFVYLTGFRLFEFGRASAMAVCLFFVVLGIIGLQKCILKRVF